MTHHILTLLRDALVHYGYWAVAAALLLESAGLPLPGETVLLLASFLAYSEHELRFPWIILVGTVATTVGGEFGFALGRHGGRPLIERYRHVFSIRAESVARGSGFSSGTDRPLFFWHDFSSVCACWPRCWRERCTCSGGSSSCSTSWEQRFG